MAYEGWTNYETYDAYLWYGRGVELSYLIDEALKVQDADEDQWVDAFSDVLQDYITHEENPLENKPSLYQDFVEDALQSIDWEQLASYIVQEAIYKTEG